MTDHIDFTEAELRQFAPRIRDGYRQALLAGKEVLREAGILDNGKRLSHFLGQFGAETGGGTIGRESLTYSSVARIRQVWPARARKETEAVLQTLVRNPVKLGDWAYGGRMGNRKGTTDGFDYRGGGFLQTTGRSAVQEYCTKCAIPIRADILDDHAATLQFACLEWKESGCNELADQNDLLGISKTINTGSATSKVIPNGMEHRTEWFGKAKAIWWDAELAPSVQPAADEPVLADTLRQTSRKFKIVDWIKGVFAAGPGGLILWASADNISATKYYADVVVGFVTSYGVPVFILLCLGGYVASEIVQHLMHKDAEEGRYTPSGEAP
jgi:putative chitinase